MASERPVIPGISSRRTACDRCRSLKLRCPRNGTNHEPCYRCTRADAACTTSPTYRIRDHFKRRPYAPTTPALHESHAQPNPVFRFATELSPPVVSSTVPEPTQVALSDPEFWHTSLQWQLNDDLSACTGDIIQVATPVSSSFSANSLDLTLTITPGTNDDQSPPRLQQICDSSSVSDKGDTPCHIGRDFIENELDSCSASWSGHSPGNLEEGSPEENSSLSFSRVNMTLATQWNQIRDPAFALTLKTLISPISESRKNHHSGILTATNDFLHVLRPLARQHDIQAISKTHANAIVPGGRHPRTQPYGPLSDVPGHKASHSLDFATALLVLSSYIHLLRIYTVHFETICSLLQEVADSGLPLLDITHENSSLTGQPFTEQARGHPQATLFIQMATNLFEQVEKLLGLPSDFRIDRDSRNAGGLLSCNGFESIMTSVIGNEALSITGGIHTLRQNVKKARELLRDYIAF